MFAFPVAQAPCERSAHYLRAPGVWNGLVLRTPYKLNDTFKLVYAWYSCSRLDSYLHDASVSPYNAMILDRRSVTLHYSEEVSILYDTFTPTLLWQWRSYGVYYVKGRR